MKVKYIQKEISKFLFCKTTDKDIEMAVLEGAGTLEKIQDRTKVGVANPKVLPEVEQLIRFYKKKHSL